MWFDSEETQKEAYETLEYQAIVADEPNLFEMDSRFLHPVMTENIVVAVDKAS